MAPKRKHNACDRPDRGFTLVELLVVIAIIALLVGIMVPVVTGVQNNARSTSTQARISSLDSACEAFKQDHHVYPGLQSVLQVGGGATSKNLRVEMEAGRITGAQAMLLSLMDYYWDQTEGSGYWAPMGPNTPGGRKAEMYIDLKPEAISNWTVYDTFPDTNRMPIAYWVARPGQVEMRRIYVHDDNQSELGGVNEDDFYDFIESKQPDGGGQLQGTGRPVREDSFIIMAAGVDREWFTDDDNTNFNRD